MKRLLPSALLLVSAAIFSDPAPARAQTAPTPLSGNYQLLNTHNIFYNGVYRPAPQPPGPHRRAEDTLVFVGAMKTFAAGKSAMTGFILDNDTDRVSQVSAGQNVAGGKILAITLDELEFQSGGVIQHVLAGQNLAGVQVFGGNAAASTTMPAAPDFSGPHGDMLKFLYERHVNELNGRQ